MKPPTALTIAGSDSSGGAGVQADLKTFLACGVHGMSALTAVTVQNSRGVSASHEVPPETVADQAACVAEDIGVDAAKTGMLASTATMSAVADAVRRCAIPALVVDPVAASQHGDPLLHPDALDTLRDVILPLATVVTPNVGEVRLLTGVDVRTGDDMEEAARAMHALGPQWVLIKGGHMSGDQSVDVLYDGNTFLEVVAPRRATSHTHGSGDTLAAAATAALAHGADVPGAVASAKGYITSSIDDSYPLGAGLGPVGHFWRIRDRREVKPVAAVRRTRPRSPGDPPPR